MSGRFGSQMDAAILGEFSITISYLEKQFSFWLQIDLRNTLLGDTLIYFKKSANCK